MWKQYNYTWIRFLISEKIMKVEAIDSKGNVYTKEVRLLTFANRWIISFGGFIEYDVEGLVKQYPIDRDFCIDMGGRNHRGIPGVCIKPKVFNDTMEKLVPALCKVK